MTMDRSSRADRVLAGLMDELADARTPAYLEAAIERASSRPQRPAWTFPERWFPMADIASRPVFAPRLPWRMIGVALVIIALVIVGTVVFIGSRQAKLPAPFGVAGNGLIAYASGGDIYTVDPLTGATTSIVAGPEEDSDPAFSPDGTRLAVLRTNVAASNPAKDIVVVRADGSDPLVVTASPIPGGPATLQWANDSRSLLASASDGTAVWLFDATTTAKPRIVATNADPYLLPFQPPNGSAILIRRSTARGLTLVRLDLGTLRETVLATGAKDNDLGAARWSPDGSKVLYNAAPADEPDSQRLFTVNADGTGARQIITAPGTWFDIDGTWSPDGSRIAFTRYQNDGSAWLVRAIGIYSLAEGSVIEVGPLPREARAHDPSPSDSAATFGEGYDFEWSPAGESLIAVPGEAAAHPVVINARDGTWRNLAPVIQPTSTKQSWQRVAP
jgi:dipeptidyl aminopeptidase/acylaminoacyl peptidase